MLKRISVVLSFFLLVNACSKVPISNRKQMTLLPESELMAMSLTSYREFLSQNPPVSSADANAQMVKRVGSKIQAELPPI